MTKQPSGPAPSREEPPKDAARSAKVTAVRVAIQTGQYVIDKDAVADNLVTRELRPIH
jgi:anti-sigma28 factor (negative regulator of flagellin synthesis)